MNDLIKQLQRIAKTNSDRFNYQVRIEPRPAGLLFVFECYESAEGHLMLAGRGPSIEAAVAAAKAEVAPALRNFGYTLP